MNLPDNRPLAQEGAYTVLAQRHEVMFRDGQALGLHPVAAHGQVHVFLRAINVDGQRWVLFDLRRLGGELHDDLLRLQPRDHPGTVFFTLRGLFPTCRAFVDALDRLVVQAWAAKTAEPALAA
jgi:hypothetical protein